MTTSPLLPPSIANLPRRRLLASAALALLGLGVAAEPEGRPRKIGYFSVLSPDVPSSIAALARFREGLRDHGLREGTDYRIEYLWEERIEQVPGRMRALIRTRPDVVVAITTPVALAAASATRDVPIIFGTVSDPVASSLVESLARPGGNVTGVANVLPALSGKLIELTREILPGAQRIAVLWNPDNPAKALELRELQVHAQQAGIECVLLPVRSAGEIDAAISGLRRPKVAALVVLAETLTHVNRERMAQLALSGRVPTFFNYAPHVEAGGLAAYSPDYDLQNRRLGELAGRILTGASPVTLPVEQPTRYFLTVNVKTARQLGVELPRAVLLRADRVVE